MPKEQRKKNLHASSVRVPARTFAAPENAVQPLPELNPNLPANDVLELLSSQDDKSGSLKKKEKRQIKREALLEKLEQNRAPYSKSHLRREKRKVKQKLTADLNDIGAVLDTMQEEDQQQPSSAPTKLEEGQPTTKKQNPALVSSSHHPSASKRQRLLKAEKLRQSVVISNSNFVANPFSAIRTHLKANLS